MRTVILITLLLFINTFAPDSANYDNLYNYSRTKIENSPNENNLENIEYNVTITNQPVCKKDGVVYEGLVNTNLPNLVPDRMLVNDNGNNGRNGDGNHGNGSGNGGGSVPLGDNMSTMFFFILTYLIFKFKKKQMSR